jgi:glucosamine-6-phosphate deaminase
MTQPVTPAPINRCRCGALEVQVYESAADLASAAAETAASLVKQTIAKRGFARVILAAGSTQTEFLDRLVRITDVPWAQVTVFHVSEFLGISAEHNASFRHLLKERIEKPLKPRVFHYLEADALEPLVECERYANLLQADAIDLCCVGMGEHGQLAFNDAQVARFTDSRWVKAVKLDMKCRMKFVADGSFPHLPSVPSYALTLTIPALCSARRLLVVAPGAREAKAINDVLQGPIDPVCPASILRQMENATLLLDRDSAGNDFGRRE